MKKAGNRIKLTKKSSSKYSLHEHWTKYPLDQVPNVERDLYHPDRDSLDTFAYQIVTALKSDLSRAVESYGSSRSASDGDSDSEEDDNDNDSQTGSNSNNEDDDRPKAVTNRHKPASAQLGDELITDLFALTEREFIP